MANLQFPINQDGAVLGSEYCSGYIDLVGKWNTGFYCPASDQSVDVFCCGSPSHKYCCTKRDQVLQEEMEGLTVMIGVVVGASTALLLLTIVTCVCCPWCPLNTSGRKQQQKNRGSMYRLATQPESASSGVTNMYSMTTGGSSGSSTPHLPPLHSSSSTSGPAPGPGHQMSHSHTLPHSLSHHHSFRVARDGSDDSERHDLGRRYGTLGRMPREQPPAYHILPRASYLLIPQDTPDLLSESRIQADTALHSLSQSLAKVDILDQEEDLYHSTKF